MDETLAAEAKVALVIDDNVVPAIVKWENTMKRPMPDDERVQLVNRAMQQFVALFEQTRFYKRSTETVYFVFQLSLPAFIKATRKGVKCMESEISRSLVAVNQVLIESIVAKDAQYVKAYADLKTSGADRNGHYMVGAINVHTHPDKFRSAFFCRFCK